MAGGDRAAVAGARRRPATTLLRTPAPTLVLAVGGGVVGAGEAAVRGASLAALVAGDRGVSARVPVAAPCFRPLRRGPLRRRYALALICSSKLATSRALPVPARVVRGVVLSRCRTRAGRF